MQRQNLRHFAGGVTLAAYLVALDLARSSHDARSQALNSIERDGANPAY